MQYDPRAPQAVRQAEIGPRAAFLQLLAQVASSLLHFIGSLRAGCVPSSVNPAAAIVAKTM